MKLLLISWYFPPSRTIAAIRLGKLARHLLAAGHDIRVLTPKDPALPKDLAFNFPAERVTRTAWAVSGGSAAQEKPSIPSVGPAPSGARHIWLKRKFWYLRDLLAPFPDRHISWRPFALQAGAALLADWCPDLIYASGPPFSTLLIGEELSRRSDVPLLVEFRDRWSDDPYSRPLFWRRRRNRRVEARLIDQAAAIITVSEPWAATYRSRYQKPTAVIYNGYDTEFCAEGPFDGATDSPGLEIVYTGGIYPGYRDPSPLFAAMKRLDDQGLACRMTFHGPPKTMIAALAEAQGVSHLVEVGEVLDHEAALKRQRESDILVLMQWNDPKEQGNVPGKFFEYLGARRPILVLGLHDGVPATILRDRGAGFFSNDSTEIAEQLALWLRIKQEKGSLPPVPESARAGFSRDEQYARLKPFLETVLVP